MRERQRGKEEKRHKEIEVESVGVIRKRLGERERGEEGIQREWKDREREGNGREGNI